MRGEGKRERRYGSRWRGGEVEEVDMGGGGEESSWRGA